MKKELEKYAFKLIKMQELSMGESIRDEIEKEIRDLEQTMTASGDEEDCENKQTNRS